MFTGADVISNDLHRKLPGDATTSCQDDEKPSDRKISGLFCVSRYGTDEGAQKVVPETKDGPSAEDLQTDRTL